MVFEVNGVKSIGATSAASGVFGQQGETKIGNIPIGQNGNAYKQKGALQTFETAVKAGDVKYVEPKLLDKLMGKENGYKINIADANTTLGDIRTKYNLSEEAMFNGGNVIDGYGGANIDGYKVPIGPDGKPYITVNAKDMSTATGISEENLKAMV